MRRLTAAEKRSDLLEINRLLNEAKDELELQIRSAQVSAVHRWVRGGPLRVRVTRRMLRLLRRLYAAGQEHAEAEAAKLGVTLERPPAGRLVATPDGLVPLDAVEALQGELDAFTRTITNRAVDVALGGPERAEFVYQLRIRAGARNAASYVTSPAFHEGLASRYIPNAYRFTEWQYSAILDSHACEPCAAQDGRVFATLAAALEVLPLFGSNPACLGRGRCRCRLHPVARRRDATDTPQRPAA